MMSTSTEIVLILSLAIGSTAELDDSRIIGGVDAPFLSYQVNLRNSSYYFICGGSIIRPKWVLTAAHCVGSLKYVMAGSITLTPMGEVHEIMIQIRHPDYHAIKLQNDVGLLKTITPMAYAPIALPTSFALPGPAVVSGWGRDVNGGSPSNYLKMLVTNVTDGSNCNLRWQPQKEFYYSTFCTLHSSGHGNCFGDSGGPLVRDGQVIGVVSWVSPTCAIGQPDGYSRVFYFVPWITTTISANP